MNAATLLQRVLHPLFPNCPGSLSTGFGNVFSRTIARINCLPGRNDIHNDDGGVAGPVSNGRNKFNGRSERALYFIWDQWKVQNFVWKSVGLPDHAYPSDLRTHAETDQWDEQPKGRDNNLAEATFRSPCLRPFSVRMWLKLRICCCNGLSNQFHESASGTFGQISESLFCRLAERQTKRLASGFDFWRSDRTHWTY